MSDLLIRATTPLVAALETGLTRTRPTIRLPSAVVVDSSSASVDRISALAHRSGIALVVDPETHLLRSTQPPTDRWTSLSWTPERRRSPEDLLARGVADALVARCLAHQLSLGATRLVLPYVHLDRADDGWLEVQLAFLAAARRLALSGDYKVPLLAVVAVSWRLLGRPLWPAVLDPLAGATAEIGPMTIALAASKVDRGVHPEDRLSDLLVVTDRLSRIGPVIGWRQGRLGEAMVAAGAAGYETGLGARERCDLPQEVAARRRDRTGGQGAAVYVEAVHAGVLPATRAAIAARRSTSVSLACLDGTCCPDGGAGVTSPLHAMHRRAARLAELDRVAAPTWRWSLPAERAEAAAVVGRRLNRVAATQGAPQIDLTHMHSVATVAHVRRRSDLAA